ncbi:MAG: peptidase T [Saprospiraceae bacterium]
MMNSYQFTAAERFMRYVQIDTQADPNSKTTPSSEKQKDLSRVLVAELLAMGISDAEMDEHGYVYATIPATSDKSTPVLCFCAHVDTAPDCSGTGVKPILHKNYEGQSIALPDDTSQVISPEDFPYLLERLGDDIITASGLTLLGSDDKAGVAEIMDAAHYLINHPEVKHGKIRLLFTPDEEIGRGVDKVDMKKLGADFGFTLDGGPRGHIEDETFSADAVTITIHGVSAHPGYAKDQMENAIKIASEIVAALPKDRLCPEKTEKKQGFVHPVSINGVLENATLSFIVRDFTEEKLVAHETELQSIISAVMKNYPNSSAEFKVTQQYRNMKVMLDKYPQIMANAVEAIKRAGIEPKTESIRGGTDGSRLSFMGLPCPNLFAGEMGIHSKKEWISVQDMNKAVETIIEICKVFDERA